MEKMFLPGFETHGTGAFDFESKILIKFERKYDVNEIFSFFLAIFWFYKLQMH